MSCGRISLSLLYTSLQYPSFEIEAPRCLICTMEDVIESGDPQTPYLYPQDLAEDNAEVPDFILDDDAGVGSPMGFSDEEYSDTSPSLSTILAIGATSPCLSPTPSLVSDVSLMSEVSAADSFEPDDTFKMKKYVHFLESVEIVPYAAEEPTLIGPLKPPQQLPLRRSRRSPHSHRQYYPSNEDIGILNGLGRAGSPKSSSLLHMVCIFCMFVHHVYL